jgi:hypothetical protein
MNVGDYVRNENGLIGKIIGFKGDMVETDNKRLITYKSDHSECKIKERLIDLIEVGDYVNGMRVKDINNIAGFVIVNTSSISENTIFTYNIKTIVTKEQFESMEYKVGD